MSSPPPAQAADLDALETLLRELLLELPPEPEFPRAPGRPPVLRPLVLWAGLLVCVLRGFTAQRALWQLLCLRGLWHFPRVEVTEQAVYSRLAELPVGPFRRFFSHLTQVLRARYVTFDDLPYARFAAEILVLDHSTLDAVARRLKLLRGVPPGSPALLPGQLSAVFDLRRQLWFRVECWEDAARNEKADVQHWLPFFPRGTLLLFDLGFFSFAWFDALTEAGLYFLSRLRHKTSYTVHHTLFAGSAGPLHLRDQWVYLGAYRADQAAHPVRLLELTLPSGQQWRYLTNVLDPALLPAAHVVELYRRRWDIEQAFHLLKSHLNLFLLWSGHGSFVQVQAYCALTLAQILCALRLEIAQRAQADLREVSLPLMLRWIPELARHGEDPVALLAARGRQAGIIRPFRGRPRCLPEVELSAYDVPTERPPPRRPRYAGKVGRNHRRRGEWKCPRKRGWGLRARRPRRA